MKTVLLQENFKSALQHVQKAVSSKPQLPILSSILFTATTEYVELAATDLFIGVKARVHGTQTESGSIALPGKLLLEGINNLPAGNLELETQDTQLTVKSKAGTTLFQGQSGEEFPPFPEVVGEVFTFDVTLLESAESYVRFSASVDGTRPVLTALNFVFTPEGLEIVATDGFRLAVLQQPSVRLEQPRKMLIPAKAITEICKIAAQEKVTQVQMIVAEEIKQLLFKVSEVEVYVRLIEGDFPPYQKIMPSGFELEVAFDGDEFASQLKRAILFARESSNIIKLAIVDETLTLSSNTSAFGNFTGTMPVKILKGTTGTIAFNGKYVQDFLATLKPKAIWFGMNESLKPAVFRPEGFTEYTYVVMPFRVND
ncbi:MAG: DNA polymerase III subunit beta [bacterium]|nr:DNA polymerase III subunit beta [bacterium]